LRAVQHPNESRSFPPRLRVSVIICCYREDRLGLLRASIESVVRQTRAPHELIVVVDHNDSLEARLKELKLPAVVVANDGPKGLSGARTKGVEVATGEIVAFVDDDATVEPDWLQELVAPYRDPLVLGVGGTAVPVWESAMPSWFPPEFFWVVGCAWTGLPVVPSPTRNLIGCNMSVRREACLAVGGFANDFFFSDRTIVNDETEFCIRLLKSQPEGRLLFLPHVVAHHYVPRERTSAAYFAKRCWREGRAKRITARIAGRDLALSRERVHLTKVIPTALLHAFRGATRGDVSALGRLIALLVGTFLTVTGFLIPTRRTRS
jgi:glycosyltransferase involved in cell wall biosynthesis